MIFLPTSNQAYPLKISLQFISEIENAYGSIYRLAEGLVDRSLSLTVIVGILKLAYRHAGCEITEEVILRQPCTELLTSILLDILGPVDRLGAVLPGEAVTAQKK